MVYLFLGSDISSKDLQLKKLRQQHLSPKTEQFNLDILYAGEISLKQLQERLLCLPVYSPKRLIVIKQAEHLRDELKEFILNFLKNPARHILLVLYIDDYDIKDTFVKSLLRQAKTFRFREKIKVDTFTLNRQIQACKPDYALKTLNLLLKEGERPERILGGLRYAWEKDSMSSLERARRLKLLVGCDVEIKTGKLKPGFALEKLVVALCGFGKPFGQA
jgi:DNA polymerase III delta subunit